MAMSCPGAADSENDACNHALFTVNYCPKNVGICLQVACKFSLINEPIATFDVAIDLATDLFVLESLNPARDNFMTARPYGP